MRSCINDPASERFHKSFSQFICSILQPILSFSAGKSGSKSPKKSKSEKSPSRRTVSFPPLIPTIVERIAEEEKAEAELENLPPSPLTSLYDGVTMKQKNTRPQFLGDWAFVKDVVQNNHTGRPKVTRRPPAFLVRYLVDKFNNQCS